MLDPCPNPWCDGKSPYGIMTIRGSYREKPWKVACTSCDLVGPNATSEAEAIAAWNRRTPPASQSDDGLQSRVLTYDIILPSDKALVELIAHELAEWLEWQDAMEAATAMLRIAKLERAEGRREGIEEAAKVAEGVLGVNAAAIRALAEKQP